MQIEDVEDLPVARVAHIGISPAPETRVCVVDGEALVRRARIHDERLLDIVRKSRHGVEVRTHAI